MDLASLPSIILAIAEQRSLNDVLSTIIGAIARNPSVSLARLWLRQPDQDCPHCARGSHTSAEALHLRASAGNSLVPGTDWSRTDGSFHRIALGHKELKISHIGTSGESVRIQRLTDKAPWIRNQDWIRSEELVGFAGHPLVFRGEVLGVLAVFRRTEPDDACWEWLRSLADAASVAIANARASSRWRLFAGNWNWNATTFARRCKTRDSSAKSWAEVRP